MKHFPILISKYSGKFDTSLKTCVFVLEETHLKLLDNIYRPDNIESVLDFTRLQELINLYLPTHNIIIHSDDLEKISQLISNNIFGKMLTNIGLSTGAEFSINEEYFSL